jgi:hypothetical protein
MSRPIEDPKAERRRARLDAAAAELAAARVALYDAANALEASASREESATFRRIMAITDEVIALRILIGRSGVPAPPPARPSRQLELVKD